MDTLMNSTMTPEAPETPETIKTGICYFYYYPPASVEPYMCKFSITPVMENLFKKALRSEFTILDVEKDNERVIDTEIRNSLISTEKFHLDILLDTNFRVSIGDEFEFIKYTTEHDHFDWHTDRERYSGHTHTVCIYPAQTIEGGALLLDKTTINMDPVNWIMVIFPIDSLHSSEKLRSGEKYLFKGTATIQKNKKTWEYRKDYKPRNGRKD